MPTSTHVPAERSFQHLVVDAAPDMQTVTNQAGIFRFVSPACRTMLGWDAPHLLGKCQDAFVHPDDIALLQEARLVTLDTDGDPVTTVFRLRARDGSHRWTEAISVRANEGAERLIVSTIRDIGDRRTTQLDLERKATTDPLTGVANRTVFMDRLHQALRRIDRRDGLVAVLFLDLDRFKLINDSVGHLIGDGVLLQLAERLRGFLRPQDTLARLGGDEFAIVVEDISWAQESVDLANRIIAASRLPFRIDDDELTCTTSVGVAVTSDSHRSAESLLQEADLALYRAKDRGRDRAEVFDEDMRSRVVGRLATERMLRRAIVEGRLDVDYQPIIDLATGRAVAAEALVRVWDDQQSRMITAESFISVAEETGLLATMDDWVLIQAVEQAALWTPRFEGLEFTDVAINVSARHLADPGFAQSVIDTLASHDLPAGALQVEVTERVLMEASNSAMTGLKALRGAGVRVGLDDFGTGYSSLSYLRMFPLDFVKIDRSFIQELATGATERAIVGSVIDLSHALGMEVVAEGIETDSQLDLLISLGCDRAQGFLFGAPGSPEMLEATVLAGESFV